MRSLGFRTGWVVIFVTGALSAAGACTSSSHDFGNPAGGSGDNGNGGEGATLGAAGAAATPGGAGGAPSGACTPGETKTCYEGADGTAYPGMPAADQTTCRLGDRTCKADGTWDACVGAVGPEAADTC